VLLGAPAFALGFAPTVAGVLAVCLARGFGLRIVLVVGGFAPRIFGLTEQFTVEGGITISTYETPGRRLA
jgi:hypothetical protein